MAFDFGSSFSGAGQGASMGAIGGPWGAAIGAVAGGLIGGFSGGAKKKNAKEDAEANAKYQTALAQQRLGRRQATLAALFKNYGLNPAEYGMGNVLTPEQQATEQQDLWTLPAIPQMHGPDGWSSALEGLNAGIGAYMGNRPPQHQLYPRTGGGDYKGPDWQLSGSHDDVGGDATQSPMGMPNVGPESGTIQGAGLYQQSGNPFGSLDDIDISLGSGGGNTDPYDINAGYGDGF